MTFRTCLLSCLLLISITASAQDKIYKTDGKIIDAKVKSVASNTITYMRFDNPDGPSYSILKKEVEKIVYQNGTVDNFNGKSSGHSSGAGVHEKRRQMFGNNMLSIMPAMYTVSVFDETIKDPGIGLCYERLLDKDGHISFELPVSVNFTQTSDFNNYYYGSGNGTSTDKTYRSVMIMPGVKFYPAKNTQKVRYALGVSLFTMFGAEPYWAYDYSGNYTGAPGDWHYTLYGLMVSNSVNISVTPHFYMALDAKLGIPFSDNRFRDQSSFESAISPIMQIMLKAGYRF